MNKAKRKEREETQQGAFNMAIATLFRIDNHLQKFRDLAFQPFDRATKQIIKIDLIKSFYLATSPLLKKEVSKKYKWILKLEPVTAKITKNGKPTGEEREIFNVGLELKMDEAIDDLSRELQDEGNYLMAGKGDPRFSWSPE